MFLLFGGSHDENFTKLTHKTAKVTKDNFFYIYETANDLIGFSYTLRHGSADKKNKKQKGNGHNNTK